MKLEEKEIWRQELLEMGARQLLSWNQQRIFVAPDQYFKTFENTLADRISDEKTFSNPVLFEQLRQNNAFEPPEGYFHDFQDRLFKKIHQNKLRSLSPQANPPRWRFASIAAAILIFIVGSWLIFSPKLMDQQLNEAEILAFIELENIDAYTVAEVFDISSISLQEATDLTEDDIQDLLDESGINEWDLEILLEEEI